MLYFLGIQLIYVAIAVLKIDLIHKSVDNVIEFIGSYDYIVVGLGSAGSVVAKRLAENENSTVLGLEAGIPQSVITDIPAFYGLLSGSHYDWKFKTVPQNLMGLSSAGHRLIQPRGKAIGGTSVINNMVYNRGNRKDYNNWAKTYGAIGWDYNNVMKYFIKAENNSNHVIVDKNPGYHGTNGSVGISSPSYLDPILIEYFQAMKSLGITTTDINGAKQLGTAILQFFIKDGLRSSTANAYLEPNPKPNNLFLSLESYVLKILIQNSSAIGVEFIKNNKTYTVYANKEIIISGGTINSPQILMLSGIGSKDHLNQSGIPVIADLPVGDNLKDHVVVEIYTKVNDPNKCVTPQFPQLTVKDLYQLYANNSGLLSHSPILGNYYNTKHNKDKSWPNTALYALAQKFGSDFTPLVSNLDPLIKKQWIKYFSQFTNQCVLIFRTQVARPKTIGTIRLNSTNPFDPPLIDPKCLSDLRDLKDFIEIIRLAFYVLEKSLLSSQVTIPKLPIPGCSYCSEKPISECDSYLECLIRQMGRTDNHQIGTCRMGSVNRSDVVVDERLRVKGIKKLRVIDASIMPEIPNSNTNAAAIMIGEYGSDLIKADNR